jgi:hypothetical protein
MTPLQTYRVLSRGGITRADALACWLCPHICRPCCSIDSVPVERPSTPTARVAVQGDWGVSEDTGRWPRLSSRGDVRRFPVLCGLLYVKLSFFLSWDGGRSPHLSRSAFRQVSSKRSGRGGRDPPPEQVRVVSFPNASQRHDWGPCGFTVWQRISVPLGSRLRSVVIRKNRPRFRGLVNGYCNKSAIGLRELHRGSLFMNWPDTYRLLVRVLETHIESWIPGRVTARA